MATSTLIQYLESADGSGTALGGDLSNRRQVETFLAGGAISAGDWCSFDGSKAGAARMLYVIEATATATVGNPGAMGVALDTVAAGEKVRVVVAGYAENASVAAATVAGSALVGPIGTDGEAAIEAPGTTTGSVCGIALEADTANLADVFVIKRF